MARVTRVGPLLGLAAAIAASIALVWVASVPDYLRLSASSPIRAAAGYAGSVGEVSARLISLEERPALLETLPGRVGLTAVVATVELTSQKEISCTITLSVDDFTWDEIAKTQGRLIEWGSDITTNNCWNSGSEPFVPGQVFTKKWAFIVPDDALSGAQSAAVDIDIFEYRPHFLRLEIPLQSQREQ